MDKWLQNPMPRSKNKSKYTNVIERICFWENIWLPDHALARENGNEWCSQSESSKSNMATKTVRRVQASTLLRAHNINTACLSKKSPGSKHVSPHQMKRKNKDAQIAKCHWGTVAMVGGSLHCSATLCGDERKESPRQHDCIRDLTISFTIIMRFIPSHGCI